MPARTGAPSILVRRERLAELLGERLRRETGHLALAAELFDGHVARGVDLGARNDARGPVLVPDPHVLHDQVEERVALLQQLLQLQLVAQIRGVLRDDAVAKQPEDGCVLLLEAQLELGLELIELVEVGHTQPILASPRARPHDARPGARDRDPARRAARGRTGAPTDADAARSGSTPRLSPARRAADRGRR